MVTIPEVGIEARGLDIMRCTITNEVSIPLEKGSLRQLSTSRVDLPMNNKGSKNGSATNSKKKKATKKFYVESVSSEWNLQST